MNKKETKETFLKTFAKLKNPFLALACTLALAQLFLNSGNNISGLPSIPVLLAKSLSMAMGKYYLLFAPFVGALGAAITGSNTVSNILFGSFQVGASALTNAPLFLILALQTVGGAIGNLLAIHNILIASATVNLHGKEGEIIKRTFWVCLIYLIIVSATGFVLFKWII